MIYFDHNASSPPVRRHYREVLNKLEGSDGNPSSIHSLGRKAKLLVEDSRDLVAKCFGAQGKNIIFTSGASEANNLALEYLRKDSNSKTVAYSLLDHPSIAEPIKEASNFKSFLLELSSNGLIDEDMLETLLNKESFDFIALTYVNGELGLINPVIKLAEFVKSKQPNCHIHVDAVQALGKIDLTNLHSSKIDSASFSAHKIGGLKGIGCLYIKDTLKAKLRSMIFGGSHEFSLRAGTENTIGIASFAEVCANIDVEKFQSKVSVLSNELLSFLKSHPNKIIINGSPEHSLCHTVNFHLKGLSIQKVLLTLEREGFLLSTRSACSSGVSGPSPVLVALGVENEIASSSLRLSLSIQNTIDEIKQFISVLKKLIQS